MTDHGIWYSPSLTNHFATPRMGTAVHAGGTGAWDHSCWSFLLVALLCFCIRGSTALIQIQVVPASPVLGGNVLLTFTFQRQKYIVNWYRGRYELALNNVILTYSPTRNSTTYGARRTGREIIFANGSLEISNLQATDNGDYTIEITTDTFPEQNSINLLIGDAPVAVSPVIQPGVVYITTTAARPAGTDGSSRENTSPVGAIVGTVVGVVLAVLLVTSAVLLYKRCQNQRRTNGEHTTDVPEEDLKIHSQTQSMDLDQRSDLTNSHLPSPAYETVLPSPSVHNASQNQEDEHVYMDLDYSDPNIYNRLQK